MTPHEYRLILSEAKGVDFLIPDFDFQDGAGAHSSTLFLLQSPGIKVLQTHKISLYNPDQTADNLQRQLREANCDLSDIVLWNIVPWINKAAKQNPKLKDSDYREAREFFQLLPKVFDALETIVFLGVDSVKQLVHFSPLLNVRYAMTHHPSPQAMHPKSHRWIENVAVFKTLKQKC